MKTNFKKILNELSYRVSTGIPDLTNEQHLMKLWDILKEHNWNIDARVELLKNLDEKADKVYTKRGKQPKGAKLVTGPRGGVYYYGDKETGEPAKPEDIPDKEVPQKEKEREEKSSELKDKLIEKELENTFDKDIRINDEKIREEMEQDTKEDEKLHKEILEMLGEIDKLDGDFKQKALALTAIGHLYGRRDNAGFGKNKFGIVDRDQLVRNIPNLLELYDEAKPELVEKGVRKVRKNKVSQKLVEETFDTLPKKLKEALGRKGKGGQESAGLHFLGYIKEDGSITGDITDPDIKKDENGELMVKRGNTGNRDRALLVWRIYLEQGGIDAYTGLPLDLESMDLEHVVALKNNDNGEPTEEDIKNRENEKNHVLTSSRANQKKSAMPMNEFIEKEVMPLTEKSVDDFEKIDRGIKEVNEIQPLTEQTALRLMDDVKYKKKGGGTITQDEIDNLPEDERPELEVTDFGTPEVADADFSPNLTKDLLKKEFEMEDKRYGDFKGSLKEQIKDKKDRRELDAIKSKIGKRVLGSLGLSTNIKTGSGKSRRSNRISTDNFYRGFAESIVSAPPEKRAEIKKAWEEALALANTDDVASGKVGSPNIKKSANQKNEIVKLLREKNLIPDEVLNDPDYKEVWEYVDDEGNTV